MRPPSPWERSVKRLEKRFRRVSREYVKGLVKERTVIRAAERLQFARDQVSLAQAAGKGEGNG